MIHSEKTVLRDLPDLWILRHGETEWNRAGRLQGQLDSPLTETGVAQARAQGAILRELDLPKGVQMTVSPLERALRTAEIANAALGLPLVQDPALMEINLGQWQGQTPLELAKTHPDLDMHGDPHLWKFGAPGGETLSEMTERVRGVLSRITAPTVIVTHGVTSRLLRALALGRMPETLSSVPGGQGIVHVLSKGEASVLFPGA